MTQDFSDTFREALEQDRSSRIDQIESRACESDRFSGVQYKIYGRVVPTQPIIHVIAQEDGYGIEELYHCNDSETHLGVFVATLPEQSHPAFV